MGKLSSIDLEKNLLGSLINKPEILAQVDGFLKDTDFTQNEHRVIYNAIKIVLKQNKEFNKPLLIHTVTSLGIRFKGALDIGEYIESISFVRMNDKAILDNAKEVIKLRLLRDIDGSCSQVSEYIEQNKTQSISEIVAKVDAIYGATMKSFTDDESPQKLMDGLGDLLKKIASNPLDCIGIPTPYKEFNSLYGGFRNKNVYAVASRPGQGKTTFLNYTGYKIAEQENIPVLFLDTEMATDEIRLRLTAALSDIPLWDIESGKWNKDECKKGKMLAFLERFKTLPVYHIHVGNKTVDEVISIARRWHWQYVGRGNKCLIVYDYIKLTGEKIGQNWAEHQAIGEKTDKLKRLTEELDCPLLTAIQINRQGENTNRNSSDVTDDSSVIAQSDKVLWFVTYMGIFRRKTADEMSRDGHQFGTHKLIDLKARYQGESSLGHHDIVERINPDDGSSEFSRNYINFNVENFRVSSMGTLVDIIRAEQLQVQSQNLSSTAPEEKTL